MSNRLFVIGIGHRARQGKDTVANFIKEMRPNVHILHFADALYEEVQNADKKWPLIRRTRSKAKSKWTYELLIDAKTGSYLLGNEWDYPYLHEIFTKRHNDLQCDYWGMNEKDSPILQFWGTDFRRNQNENYWVEKVQAKISELVADPKNNKQDMWIVISDVRFKNEVNLIKTGYTNGFYIKVVRTNEDGSQYIDESRDPQHPSESELNDETPFVTLYAKSGNLLALKNLSETVINAIEHLDKGLQNA